jgi:hypothetical protein
MKFQSFVRVNLVVVGTDLGPSAVGSKHYNPGTEYIYVLEGALSLEEGEVSLPRRYYSASQCQRYRNQIGESGGAYCDGPGTRPSR